MCPYFTFSAFVTAMSPDSAVEKWTTLTGGFAIGVSIGYVTGSKDAGSFGAIFGAAIINRLVAKPLNNLLKKYDHIDFIRRITEGDQLGGEAAMLSYDRSINLLEDIKNTVAKQRTISK